MNSKVLLIASVLCGACLKAQAFEAKPTTLTTADIVSAMTLDRTCLNYCITGVCVWLRCSLSGCSVETSIKVSHYNPDLVVSVYDEPGENPWQEMESLLGSLDSGIVSGVVSAIHDAVVGGGHRVEGGNPATDQSLRFKEVTAIGHPFASVSDFIGDTGFYCPSEAESFNPYLLSSLDALTWRLGLPEFLYLQNLLPGRRVIGSGIQQQWGAVWPRTGFINQKDDAKAAAVIAQRAGNIVTQSRQPHIYNALNGNGYRRSWLPGELLENDPGTGVWQMLAPKVDEQCYVFGENDVLSTSWSQGRHSEDHRYAFTLWRPYECCEDRGSYLFTVPIRMCL